MSTLSHDENDLGEEVDEEVEEVAPEAAEPTDDDQITFNGKRVSVDVGLKRCVALIEKGTGSWKCTNVIKSGASFEISCATCDRKFSLNNPARFWRDHKKTKCAMDRRGQVLERGASL